MLPPNFLDKIDNILFMIDPSVRDFIRLHSYIAEIARLYPKITVDLVINPQQDFIFSRSKRSFQVSILLDIFREQTLFNKIYFEPNDIKKLITQVRTQNYQAIVLLDKYAHVRNIELVSKLNFEYLIGTIVKVRWFNFFKKRAYGKLNYKLEMTRSSDTNVQSLCSVFFSSIGLENIIVKPFLQIPQKWIIYAKLKFLKWGIDKRGTRFGRVFFINPFDEDCNCEISLKKVLDLITKLKHEDEWNDVNFIMHVPLTKLVYVRKFFAKNSVNNLFFFVADYNFFQVPAILSLCDAIFTADGVCLDLASAFNIPVNNDLFVQYPFI